MSNAFTNRSNASLEGNTFDLQGASTIWLLESSSRVWRQAPPIAGPVCYCGDEMTEL